MLSHFAPAVHAGPSLQDGIEEVGHLLSIDGGRTSQKDEHVPTLDHVVAIHLCFWHPHDLIFRHELPPDFLVCCANLFLEYPYSRTTCRNLRFYNCRYPRHFRQIFYAFRIVGCKTNLNMRIRSNRLIFTICLDKLLHILSNNIEINAKSS